jgi:hypothetical protein
MLTSELIEAEANTVPAAATDPKCFRYRFTEIVTDVASILLTNAAVITTVLPKVKYPCIVIEGNKEPYRAFPDRVIAHILMFGNVISLKTPVLKIGQSSLKSLI